MDTKNLIVKTNMLIELLGESEYLLAVLEKLRHLNSIEEMSRLYEDDMR